MLMTNSMFSLSEYAASHWMKPTSEPLGLIIHELEEIINEEVGNVIIACVYTGNEALQELIAADIELPASIRRAL